MNRRRAVAVAAGAFLLAPAAASAADGWLAAAGLPPLVAAGLGALAVLALAGPLLLWQHRRLRLLAKQEAANHIARRALAEALAAAPDGFYRWDRHDDGEECSRRLAVLLGLARGTEAHFDDVLAAFAPEDGAALRAAVAGLHEAGEGFALDLSLADGRRRVMVEGIRAADFDGRPLADLVWMRDVTESARAVAALRRRADALAAERDRLRALLDALPVPVWLRDGDLSLRHANQAYAKAVDAESGEEAVRRGLELVPASAVRQARALAARARAAGTPRSDRFHLVVQGARRLVEVTELPMPGEEGEGGGLLTAGFAFDVSRQEELQEELSRHIASHAQMLQNLQSAIAVFDGDRRLSFHNEAFERLWRLEPEWLAATPDYGGFLDELRQRRLLPEVADYPAFRQGELRRFVSLIEPVEDLLHLPDGRTLRRVVAPHPFGGLVFTFEDVTDTLALERSYNTLIAVQRETLDNLHEGVAVFGADGRLRLSNPAFGRIWDLRREHLAEQPHIGEMVEAHRRFFADEADWAAVRDALVGLVNDRHPRRGRIERADGTILDYASVPLPDGATLITWMDVTDPARVERALRERNEALREANRLKSEFIASVSAEVRTPLNTIVGFAETLEAEVMGGLDPRQRDYVQGIREAGQALTSLIKDIIDLAAVEAGQMTLQLDTFDIHALLAGVQGLMRARVREKGVALDLDCPADIGWMVADERRVKQVLFNLLGNALTFTPEGGSITLTARREEGQVVFTVADTGVGIPRQELGAVFERFTRGNRPEARQKGAGLGLALVKSFVELHGGAVMLDSRPGQGTTVTVRLPAGDARPAQG